MSQLEQSLKSVWEKNLSLAGPSGEAAVLPPKPLDKSTLLIRVTLSVMAFLSVYALIDFDYKNMDILEAVGGTLDNLFVMFITPGMKHFTFMEAMHELLITVGLAILTTVLSSILALFLGLLGAQNLTNAVIANAVRSFVSFIRAVPTVLWVLIFAVAAGLGSVAAVIGMSFHAIGYLAKAYAESFEELDKDVIEALTASGANWWQIVFQAVLPSSLTYLISWTFLRFEINFTNAVAMGAAAGAGGIGFDLYMAGGHYFNLHEVGFTTYCILVVALLLEFSTTRAKMLLKTNN